MEDIKIRCSCGNQINNSYCPDIELYEYVGVNEENNPVFRCKTCKEYVYG